MNNTQKINSISKELNQIKSTIQTQKLPIDIRAEWMNPKEVGHALGMSESTLLRLRKCGALPFSRVHGKIFYKRIDVEQMLENNYVKIDRSCCNC